MHYQQHHQRECTFFPSVAQHKRETNVVDDPGLTIYSGAAIPLALDGLAERRKIAFERKARMALGVNSISGLIVLAYILFAPSCLIGLSGNPAGAVLFWTAITWTSVGCVMLAMSNSRGWLTIAFSYFVIPGLLSLVMIPGACSVPTTGMQASVGNLN